ncbi:MAG: excinuclease ABC subunit UvrC [Elusimicrobia bacterium]|nr:excinuclease ABC subunit UvrC [Elusimicrobiota bacterium]
MDCTEQRNRLPRTPGVYLMRDTAGTIIYIGKANNLKARVASYFRTDPSFKTVGIIAALRHIDYVLCASEREALIVERQLINRYQPFYNAMWKDDKSYPYLKITVREDFPRIMLTRRKIDDGNQYFGPFPEVQKMKQLLYWMQKIFKWRPCKLSFDATHLPPLRTVKSCLYFHTNRCPGPCRGAVTAEEYKKSLRFIQLFLKRDYLKLESLWHKEMQEASRGLDFEKAAELRDRISAVRHMDQPVTMREVKNEDLVDSLDMSRCLEQMREELSLPRLPVVIEGFDISLLAGTAAVGSMVLFHNGKQSPDRYRRYKIKTVSGTDDYAMLAEVVTRRYRRLMREKLPLPDLILIDGGKGQLAAAVAALNQLQLSLPVISLAKQQEEIFIPGRAAALLLPRRSPVLRLLQSVRDESHRFALAYHRTLRKRAMHHVN